MVSNISLLCRFIKLLTHPIKIVSLPIIIVFAEYHCDQSSDVEKHLEMGRLMLARNQLQDALTHYHAAVGKLENFIL